MLLQSLAARKLRLDLACRSNRGPMYALVSEDQASRKRWREKHFPNYKKIRGVTLPYPNDPAMNT